MNIETKRLIITEFTLDMSEAVANNSTDEDNRKFVPDEVWETSLEAEKVLKLLISNYDFLRFPLVYPIILKKTGENIGYVQMCKIGKDKWEIGYHVAKRYTGNGYASEAVQAFLPVMAGLLNIRVVYGISLAQNIASVAVMKKCGFINVFTGTGLYQGKKREIVENVWKVHGKINDT